MKHFNKSQFIWFIILAGFSLFLIYLISTGKIYIFINPSMVKYTVFCAVFFVILTLSQIRKIFMISRNNKLKLGYLLFLLPLILGLYTKGFDSSIVNTKGITLSETNKAVSNTKEAAPEVKKNYINDGVVTFSDLNFYELLNDINDNINEYNGKKIRIIGQVYKDKNFNTDEFVVSRMMMSCCAADAQVVGLLCSYTGSKDLKIGEWIKVNGTIDTTMYYDQYSNKKEKMPIIIVDELQQTENGQKYIYP